MPGDDLVQEAFQLTGVRTKRELVHLAPKELVRRSRKRDLTELAGKIRLRVRVRGVNLRFWDSLILESALRSRCARLLTEDMHDELTIDSLTIRNPFVATAPANASA